MKTSTPFDLIRQRFPQLIAKWKTIKQEGSVIKYDFPFCLHNSTYIRI